MTDIHKFEDCLDIANRQGGAKKKHLMLGNGFSISLFPTIFNYKALVEQVNSSQVKDLFTKLGTSDFEYVMRRLTDTLELVKIYSKNDPDDPIANQIESDLDEIRDGLIQAISKSHPPKPNEITDEQYDYCHSFLKHFDGGKKYTFNYDLLLYWVYMHFLDMDEKKLKFDDGFRHPEDNDSTVTWEIGREKEQNVYYVHGAMHIFNYGAEVEKFTWINTGLTISDQVRKSIDKGKYPIFISEGTTEHKLSRIQNFSYLGRSFSSLKSITGNLFIFGHSIGNQDDHVFNYINRNQKLKNIFISIFGDVDSDDNQRIISKVKKWADKHPYRNYYFYDAADANVWGP